MPYEFTDRVFLGTIPGLTRGTHPLNDPPSPSTNAGVRQNYYPIDRAGELEVYRFSKLEVVGEFAADAGNCTVVCYQSRVNPAATDLSPITDTADTWETRLADFARDKDTANAAQGSIVRFTIACTQWFTLRVIAGTPPTTWRVYGIFERGASEQAIG